MKNPMFAFAACLRHAFLAGVGYENGYDRVDEADLDRWTEYDPPSTGAFKTMADIIAAAGCEEATETMLLHPNVFGRYTTGKVSPIVANIEEFEAAMERANKAIREFVPPPSTTGVSIVAATVKVDELVTSISRPGRHHDILNTFKINEGCEHLVIQGFLTSAGTFVNRETALELAIKSGQFKFGPDHRPVGTKRELFSEDLW